MLLVCQKWILKLREPVGEEVFGTQIFHYLLKPVLSLIVKAHLPKNEPNACGIQIQIQNIKYNTLCKEMFSVNLKVLCGVFLLTNTFMFTFSIFHQKALCESYITNMMKAFLSS